jgi:hypothetical protein
MRNKDFIANLVLEELNNRKFNLNEAVSSWPAVKQIFSSNGVSSYIYDGTEIIAYPDLELGDIKLMSDGTGYIEDDNKTVNWKLIKNSNGESSIKFDSHILDLSRISYSTRKTTNLEPVIKHKTASRAKASGIDQFQTALDWLGIIPGFGDILDAINAIIYFARGKYLDGTLSLVAIIPVVGSGIKLGLKGSIAAIGGATSAAKIWKKAAGGSTDELVAFYRTAIESGSLTKLQLLDLARYGDTVASLLTSSKFTIKSKEAVITALGVDAKAVLKQIDDVILIIKNTTSIPVKKSFMSKVGTAIKSSKIADKTLQGGKIAFNFSANIVTVGGYGIARNLLKKIGIGKREMGYLRSAMDLRFTKKIQQSPTLVYSLFRSNGSLKAAEAAALGIPPWLQARSAVEVRNWFVKLQKTNPKQWKTVTEFIATEAANKKNVHYMTFVENQFQQASNIFRPGTVFKTGAPEMFAKALKLDSYRLSNPKNLDIVSNEIEDLAEKLGLDKQDDPQGVIMPAIWLAFSEFLTTTKKKVVAVGAAGIVPSLLGGETEKNAKNSIPGGEIVDTQDTAGVDQIKTDFKEAPGVTTDKLNALYEKGYDEEQIYALKKILDID